MKAEPNRISQFFDEPGKADPDTEPLTETSSCQDDDDTQIDSKLADILDDYLCRLEAGRPITVDQLIFQYPQYEQPLREYLAGLNLLNAGVAEMDDSPFQFHDEHQQLGDYELIREIGRGGMGVVYEARQVSLNRRVALKVLPFASMLDQRQIVRFETEARAAASLQHPHIVSVHEVGCDRGVHYYAMQFVEGHSVRELIDTAKTADNKTTPQYSPREVARLGAQAASALQAAHTCGVVHRDIKPSNLLLDSLGDVWIADFGLARSQADSNVTQSGDILGTLHYMSPEQARGSSSIADPRSDTYSLGVTLYELLTHRRPFDGDSHADILRQIEIGNSKSLRSINPDVPRDLENVIAKAMSLDPNDRYRTATDLEEDLLRFLDGRVTLAKPASVAQRLYRWSARHRSVVASVAVIAAMALLTLACSTFWLAGERAELEAKNQTADQKLRATEATFEEFGLATAERLKQIPGTESARKSLLGELLNHYEDLLDAANDDSVREDRAITSTKIANLHREIGELPLALASYRDAVADFESLATHSDDRLQAVLATCRSNMSVVLFELGKHEEARSEVQLAIDVQSRLAVNDPRRMADLAASHANLATVLLARDSGGVVELEKAAKLAGQAKTGATAEDLPAILRTQATIYGRISSHWQSSDISKAIDYARLAVTSSNELLETLDSSQGTARLHALHCNNLASMLATHGNYDEAIQYFRIATAELEKIDDRDELVGILDSLAKIESRHGSAIAAEKSYQKAITVQTSLLLESPGNLNHASRLGGLCNNHALALQRMGKQHHACIAYEQAIEYQNRAYQLAPKRLAYYRDALSRTLFNASKAAIDINKPHVAAEFQERRAELWPGDAQQVFSAAWGIAAATDRMSPDDTQKGHWIEKASRILDAAVKADSSMLLDRNRVSDLTNYLAKHAPTKVQKLASLNRVQP